MIAVRQKTLNYCFVACLASALLDGDVNENHDKLQDQIVARFPEELQEGHPFREGIAEQKSHINQVIIGLGLATTVQRVACEPNVFLGDLRNGKLQPHKIILGSRAGSFHCWRIESVQQNHLIVMNPSIGNFELLSDHEFASHKFEFIVLDHPPLTASFSI